MNFNIGKIGGYQAGLAAPQSFGAKAPATKPKSFEVADKGLLNRLNNINCELTPNLKGGDCAGKLDFMA